MNQKKYFGYVSLIGKSNVGKSTILNKILNQKISITSKKVYTTQDHIIGIHTNKKYQIAYIDTPGIQKKNLQKIYNYKKYMQDVVLIIFVLAGTIWDNNDENMLNQIQKSKKPVLIILNKIDLIKKKEIILKHISFLNKKCNFVNLIPISAKNGFNINIINNTIYKYLTPSSHLYEKNTITIQSNKFLISEIIREKLIRFLGDELPYSIVVKVTQISFESSNYKIYANILVKKKHKKIIIGKKGKKIKKINFCASKDIFKFLKKPIFLTLWVKDKA